MDPILTNNQNNGNETDLEYIGYKDELQLDCMMKLIGKDLSEPYSIFTYRYFLINWPNLSFLAVSKGEVVGVVISKLDKHKNHSRGYIAMLAVDSKFRKRGIGSSLVKRSVLAMKEAGADEVVLEADATNQGALNLYEQLGFIRAKRLYRYYLTGVDAYRLKLWLRQNNI